MKGVIVKFETPQVTVNGRTFDCLISPMELHAKCRGYMAQMMQINPGDEDQVRGIIAAGCEIVDEALGSGAMAKIANGQPVSLPGAVAVLNAIMDAVNAAYRGYIRREYTGGHR